MSLTFFCYWPPDIYITCFNRFNPDTQIYEPLSKPSVLVSTLYFQGVRFLKVAWQGEYEFEMTLRQLREILLIWPRFKEFVIVLQFWSRWPINPFQKMSRYMEVGQPKLGNPPVIYSDTALGKNRFVCCIMIFAIGKGRCSLSSEYTWWDICWKLPRSSPIINTLAPTKKTIHSQIWKERSKKVFLHLPPKLLQ